MIITPRYRILIYRLFRKSFDGNEVHIKMLISALFTGYRKWTRTGLIYLLLTSLKLNIIMEAIKPGPKPKKDNGQDDQRRRVLPETKPKHPDLKPHVHKPKD